MKDKIDEQIGRANEHTDGIYDQIGRLAHLECVGNTGEKERKRLSQLNDIVDVMKQARNVETHEHDKRRLKWTNRILIAHVHVHCSCNMSTIIIVIIYFFTSTILIVIIIVIIMMMII